MATSAPDVTVSLTIGESPTPTPQPGPTPPPKKYLIRPLVIYGYGPAGTQISLTGYGVLETTMSKSDGYFAFENIDSAYPELCLQALDSERRLTYPVCIPKFSENTQIAKNIGPILLSPTISIDNNNILIGEETYISGYAIPKSKVDIHLFKNQDKSLFSLVGEVFAYDVPIFETKADKNGKYSFTLPSQDTSKYNIYTASIYDDNFSPKSNTLNFSVLTKTKKSVLVAKEALSGSGFMWVVLVEVIIVIFLVRAILKSPSKRKKGKSRVKSQDNTDIKKRYLELLKSKGLIS